MAWQEKLTRGAFIAAFAAIPAALGIKEARRRKQEKAAQDQWAKQMLERGQREIPWWPSFSLFVETSNTKFIQDEKFSPGPAFGQADPIAFPFIVRIEKEAVKRLREELSAMYPPNRILEVHATKPDVASGGKYDETGEKLTISLPFDSIVAEHVFPNFSNRNLLNETVAKDFTQAIAHTLFVWMLYEVHYASATASIQEDSDEKELLFWMANLNALHFATDTSRQLRSPFVIEPIPLFHYEDYYQGVIDRLATTQ